MKPDRAKASRFSLTLPLKPLTTSKTIIGIDKGRQIIPELKIFKAVRAVGCRGAKCE